ncbi:MAG: hypothetical protein M3R17_20945 [Bacteroidota bacterium]|nr:hypothetical protein [Bacteroidota bacterium]
MTFEDASRWQRLSLLRHFRAFEKQLMARNDKRILLALRIARVKEFLLKTELDPYSSKIVKIYVDNYGNGIPLQKLLDRIETLRAQMYQVRYHGEKFPWTEVAGDFVNEKRPEKIIKHIVCWYCCQFALNIYSALLNEVEKDCSDKALKKIFDAVYEMKPKGSVKKEKNTDATGFEWNNKQKAEKLSKVLYSYLLKEHFIDSKTEKESFCAAFNGAEIEEKIHWTKSLPHLIYLFLKLAKDELKTSVSIDTFITSEKWVRSEQLQFSGWLYPKLTGIFIDEKGQALDSSKLRNAFNQLKNRSVDGLPLRAADVDEIMSELFKIR